MSRRIAFGSKSSAPVARAGRSTPAPRRSRAPGSRAACARALRGVRNAHAGSWRLHLGFFSGFIRRVLGFLLLLRAVLGALQVVFEDVLLAIAVHDLGDLADFGVG